jgi:hypothetical protein
MEPVVMEEMVRLVVDAVPVTLALPVIPSVPFTVDDADERKPPTSEERPAAESVPNCAPPTALN